MTTRNRPTATLLLACLATLALPACSPGSPDAGQPNTSSTPSGSTSATTPSNPSQSLPPSATTAPGRPAGAEGLTLAAAEAFLNHYVALLNFTYSTGDTEALLAASDKGCVGCSGTADYLKKTNGKNGGLSGDYIDHLVEVKELFKGSSGRIGGSLTVRSGNYTERSTATSAPVQKKAHTETWQFTLSPLGTNWVMYEIQVDE